MDKSAIEKVAELATKACEVQFVDGVPMTAAPLTDARFHEPVPPTVEVRTLTSLATLLLRCPTYGSTSGVVVVASPTEVRFVTHISGALRRRAVPYLAAAAPPTGFRLGQWYPPPEAIIGLRTHFHDTEELRRLLATLGNLRHEAVQTHADDGVSQTVTARAGIVRVESVTPPAVVNLAMRRTFPEVYDPTAPFFLRLRGGGEGDPPEIALFSCDGGAWANDTMDAIRDRMDELLNGPQDGPTAEDAVTPRKGPWTVVS